MKNRLVRWVLVVMTGLSLALSPMVSVGVSSVLLGGGGIVTNGIFGGGGSGGG